MSPTRPLPKVSPEAQPFWDGCRDGKLLLQTCVACGQINWFPRAFCHRCTSEEFRWEPASGRATLETYSIVYRPMNEAWVTEVPYTLAIVMLEEGIRMVTRLVHPPGVTPAIDRPVTVCFQPIEGGFVLPYFEQSAA